MSSVQQVKPLYEELKKEFSNKRRDVNKCKQLISKMKIALLTLNFFPNDKATKAELIIARDFLEICCQLSIETEDVEAFERYFVQLKTYYFDFRTELPESAYMHELVGCHLLCLLSQNKLAQFHSELEMISIGDLLNNIYIKHPVSIEQYLMEGSYNKIFLSKSNLPSERCKFFIEVLSNTIRDEIAECMEKSYESISLQEAAGILFFEDKALVKPYALQRQWQVDSVTGLVAFKREEKEKKEIDSDKMINDFVNYAVQLETII
ncbi:26S proteasome non-ATPase regulatory subunit 8-like [Symsagittifera roscoffensis]|uniref:26S proteasome non-ATPase regulatory subunit 8-like n=1 Tax=Symsagittifera roscoffensis TaxID=84072 RepID=UPI00307C49A5